MELGTQSFVEIYNEASSNIKGFLALLGLESLSFGA